MVGGQRLSTGKEGKMAGAKTGVAAERDLSGFFFFFQRKERSPTSIKEIGFRFRFSPPPLFFSFFFFPKCLVKHMYFIFFFKKQAISTSTQ
jgi:hypothetical protein